MGDTHVRPWSEDDAPSVATLLATDASPVWAAQGHALHGPAWREGGRWRQTWVAERGGHIGGAVTVATNRVHDERLLCAVEVADRFRRQGLGSLLLQVARDGAPDDRPFTVKVAPTSAGHYFCVAVGGVVYQRCDGATFNPRSAGRAAWPHAGAALPRGARVEPLSGWPRERLVSGFVNQYLWVHEQWSPVTSTGALIDIARQTVDDHDAALGTAAVVGDHLAALVLAFRAGDHRLEVVAETQRRDTPHGTALLTACLARTLRAAAAAGIRAVKFDGHVTDPHLHPLLQQLPPSTTNPLLLVEIPSRPSHA